MRNIPQETRLDEFGNYIQQISGSTYKTMGVQIDLSDSNPATCCTYTDDAIGMTQGSLDWDIFFGHKPCLFKDGAVVGYLRVNDFSKFENGSMADITTGGAGVSDC